MTGVGIELSQTLSGQLKKIEKVRAAEKRQNLSVRVVLVLWV